MSRSLKAGEDLCAFFDDIYLVCEPDIVRFLYDQLAEALSTVAGIRLHQGKTRFLEHNRPVSRGHRRSGARGVEHGWYQGSGDLQCAWQILLQSASPRANHSFRTMPPSSSEKYAREQDEGIWTTVKGLFDEVPGSGQELTDAAQVASLPMRM